MIFCPIQLLKVGVFLERLMCRGGRPRSTSGKVSPEIRVSPEGQNLPNGFGHATGKVDPLMHASGIEQEVITVKVKGHQKFDLGVVGLSYQELGQIMDDFLFRVYSVFLLILILVFLLIIPLGATAQSATGYPV